MSLKASYGEEILPKTRELYSFHTTAKIVDQASKLLARNHFQLIRILTKNKISDVYLARLMINILNFIGNELAMLWSLSKLFIRVF